MANVPFLYPRPLKPSGFAWHWKPSPRLRALGFDNRKLGETPTKRASAEILAAAVALNDKVAAWQAGTQVPGAAPAPPLPKHWTFGDVVDAYRASEHFRLELKPATRKEYESRITQLLYWAEDGALPVAQLDRDMVVDLKKTLLENGGSKFKCAAMLRVLRVLVRYAKAEHIIAHDPTEAVPIPSPPSRAARLAWSNVRDMAAACEAANPVAARALRIGFWTMQRREDLCQLNRFQWRELHGADPRDVPALANARGEIWGFRLRPGKTETTSGREVDCPMPPWLHPEIEAAFRASQWLFPHPQDPAKPIPGYLLRRRVKPVLVAGGFPRHQLRDLRRSAMSGVKDLGALKSDVFAISGHPLDGQRTTMADVYMPPDTMAACRAIAAACRTLAAIEARDKEQGR